MRAATAAFERASAVREAARQWLKAGVVDERTVEEIESRWADPRLRPSWIWRVLTALLASAVVLGVLFAVAVGGLRGTGGLAFVFLLAGGLSAAATELQESDPAFARRGGAGATAFWSGVLLVSGAVLALDLLLPRSGEAIVDLAAAVSVLVWGAASWRWGSALFALFSTASALLLVARQPFGRTWVLALGLALALLARRRVDDPALPPPHRVSAAALLVTALAALYAAVNYWSFESWWIERLRSGFSWAPRPAGLLAGSALLTVLLPAAVLAWGIRSKRLFLADTGALLLILSAVTLRHYVRLGPLWAVLGVAGAVLLLVALALERWLSRGEKRERNGWTAEPLFSDEERARMLQAIPVALTLPPTAAPPPEKGFTPGGGSFGGGGASDRF